MIAQITPLVQAVGRRNWLLAVGGHIAGAVLSASLLGFVLGAFGIATGLSRWGIPVGLIVGTVLLTGALREVEVMRWRFPSLHRQTPRNSTCYFGPVWGAFAWGFDLGQGWTTWITFTGYYGLVLWTVLGASPTLGAGVLGAYGLGRALPVFVAGLFAKHFDVNQLSDAYVKRFTLIRQVNGLALALVAGFMLVKVW